MRERTIRTCILWWYFGGIDWRKMSVLPFNVYNNRMHWSEDSGEVPGQNSRKVCGSRACVMKSAKNFVLSLIPVVTLLRHGSYSHSASLIEIFIVIHSHARQELVCIMPRISIMTVSVLEYLFLSNKWTGMLRVSVEPLLNEVRVLCCTVGSTVKMRRLLSLHECRNITVNKWQGCIWKTVLKGPIRRFLAHFILHLLSLIPQFVYLNSGEPVAYLRNACKCADKPWIVTPFHVILTVVTCGS